jgi:hypothetical protein
MQVGLVARSREGDQSRNHGNIVLPSLIEGIGAIQILVLARQG